MSFVLEHMQNNIWRGKFSLFPEEMVQHGISARLGGQSQGEYASLNMGLHVGDDPLRVVANRKLFLHALELKAEYVCSPQQVHGDVVRRVTMAERGRGATDYADALPETDALITNEPGLPLLLCFADCVPLLFVDPEHQAIGAAHAGWKGTVAHIAEKTATAMEQEFGTRPEDLLVGIGPSIGPECFVVGEEVAERFRTAGLGDAVRELAGEIHVDLWEANRRQLLEAGVKTGNIDCAETCTACQHKWYYSYRADGGKTGRLAAVIALRPY